MARDTGTRDTRPQTNGRAKRYVAPYKKEFAAYSRTPVQSKVMRAARIFIVLSLAAVVFPEAAIAGDLRIPGRADESGARYLRSPVQSADGSTALAPNTHGADLPFQARLAVGAPSGIDFRQTG